MVGSQDEEKHSSPPAAIRTEQGKQPRDIHGIRVGLRRLLSGDHH